MGLRTPPKLRGRQHPLTDEPDDLNGFLEYIRARGIVGYRAGCECYSCNVNRIYFKKFWFGVDTPDPV